MINAGEFVECASTLGYSWYSGVPCSLLTPLINYAIDDAALSYVAAANEGDAVAAAAGAFIGGQRSVALMQNSGLGNAVSPLSSLTYVFRVPVLLVITLRGEPGQPDEPQHELMGRITGTLLESLEIPWSWFPASPGEISPVLEQAHVHMQRTQRPYALIMHKGSVSGSDAASSRPPVAKPLATDGGLPSVRGAMPTVTRREALARVLEFMDPEHSVIIASTGYNGRELYALADRPNHLYMVGSMGCASALGLGLSITRSDLQVVVIDGDGAVLMRMGNLATIGSYGGDNLVHILLDNEAHESTGAQATVSGSISLAGIARSCAYPHVEQGGEPGVIDRLFYQIRQGAAGPHLAHLKTLAGTTGSLPRPDISPVDVCQRLMTHIGSCP